MLQIRLSLNCKRNLGNTSLVHLTDKVYHQGCAQMRRHRIKSRLTFEKKRSSPSNPPCKACTYSVQNLLRRPCHSFCLTLQQPKESSLQIAACDNNYVRRFRPPLVSDFEYHQTSCAKRRAPSSGSKLWSLCACFVQRPCHPDSRKCLRLYLNC